MAIRDRIVWKGNGTFDDPRLNDFDRLIADFRRGNSHGWRTAVFENRKKILPVKPDGHYKEYYVGPRGVSGSLRIVLGKAGEIYISGNHYYDFRQVVGL